VNFRKALIAGIKSGETAEAVFFYDTSSLPPVLRTIAQTDITASARHSSSDRNSPVTLAEVAN
jgi:hypothetical protein